MIVNGASAGGVATAAPNDGNIQNLTDQLGRDDFMRLLVTQLRHQNPLEPVNNTEFIAQLAQFSSLDGIEKLHDSFEHMLLLQGVTQGANLIGKEVEFTSSGDSFTQRGRVEAVHVAGGQVELQIDGIRVGVNQLRTVVG